MDTRFISPLAGIIGIVNGSFLILDRIKKMDLVEIIKVLLVCLASTVFIKETICMTYLYQEYIFSVYRISFILLGIYLFLYYRTNNPFIEKNIFASFIKDNMKVLTLFLIVFLSLFLYQPMANTFKDHLIENFSYDKITFISGLSHYQVSNDIFIYLKENLFITLSIVIDTINIVVAFHAMINTYRYFRENIYVKSYKHKLNANYEDDTRYLRYAENKAVKLSFITLFISTGFSSYVLNQIFEFF